MAAAAAATRRTKRRGSRAISDRVRRSPGTFVEISSLVVVSKSHSFEPPEALEPSRATSDTHQHSRGLC